ncbi:mitochondrial import receptor subunit Tom22 [Tilletia horrida]|uniref:Mitochondrial import receptor subunit Tom22 n=1 Tax=Tilletia horrida TaxID=155126 RepID=A0AAN6JPU0_9BASI|nr:mitochondrial import receptor subunit Tom22 [Tilletia horrida]KAK0547375.1 mitochondrial import receptor subunit Tom22 [Tilletia horrida]KAK0564346.1 mitochondrial import receptor subunit Tom22 [Tilletia horrida]
MVVIEEVQDEDQRQQQRRAGPASAAAAAGVGSSAAGVSQEGDWRTDDGESTDSEQDEEDDEDDDDEDVDPSKESIFERIAALKDIIPPQTRRSIASTVSTVTNVTWFGGRIIGSLGWVVTTSALVVALPLMLALEDEARIVQQEREMPPQGMIGAPQPGQVQPGQPGQQQPQANPSGIRPPGF